MPPATATVEPVIVERVLIISIDGLRGDAVSSEVTPNLLALAASGASTFRAQTVLPSSTLPAHASMLSGYDVPHHGVTWNDYIPSRGYIQTATVFTLAHAAGYRTVMVVGKEKLVQLAVPDSVDSFTYVPAGDFDIAQAGVAEIQAGFGVLFVHLIGPDAAGHAYGWMSATYLRTAANSDEAVRRLLAALDEAGLRQTTLVIVTADHGGHGTTHGSDRPEDMTIPWIVAGPGVRAGLALPDGIRVFDTAATAAWALGLTLPADMDGRPVVEAFFAAPTQLTDGE
jgi:predicted AlkP superfamily pyrophosphatase or phosphodiesterase